MALLMKPTDQIYGLHLYGLTPSALARLGATPVRIEVMLDTFRITPALRRLRPEQRGEFLKARAAKMRRAVFPAERARRGRSRGRSRPPA